MQVAGAVGFFCGLAHDAGYIEALNFHGCLFVVLWNMLVPLQECEFIRKFWAMRRNDGEVTGWISGGVKPAWVCITGPLYRWVMAEGASRSDGILDEPDACAGQAP